MSILVKDARSIFGHLGRRPGRGGRQPVRVHMPPVIQPRPHSVSIRRASFEGFKSGPPFGLAVALASRLRVGIFFLIFCPVRGGWHGRF
jgi:hypothetical protein